MLEKKSDSGKVPWKIAHDCGYEEIEKLLKNWHKLHNIPEKEEESYMAGGCTIF